MNVQNDVLSHLDAILREVSLENRIARKVSIEALLTALGLDPKLYGYFFKRVSYWPAALNRDSDLRYVVDFDHGDTPEPGHWLASFEEVRALLKYTPGSMKVAFGAGRGKVERVRKPTKLGACVIYRLTEVPPPEELARAKLLRNRVTPTQRRFRPGDPARKGTAY
jgi:hypothetical protein